MNYLTMAKLEIAGKKYVVCECRLLENIEACTIKAINGVKEVEVLETQYYKVLNPTQEFVSDLNKIVSKISRGDTSKYYRGDYSKYYITDYDKVVNMFEKLEAKAS